MIRKVTPKLSVAARLTAIFMLTCVAPPAPARPQGMTISHDRVEARPTSTLSRTLVLGYEEFGPQVMAYELIGFGWNQWKAEGHELPDDVEVKVVIYRGVRLGRVKAAYPVVRGKSDYRYVEYGRALRFLDRKIEELEEQKREGADPDSVRLWEELLATLKGTKSALVRALA